MKRWGRRVETCYLLALLVSSLLAPHRHLNPIADLISDGPSDSGTFLRAVNPSAGGQPAFSKFNVVDDDACLACFSNDFRAFAATPFLLDIQVSTLPYVSP